MSSAISFNMDQSKILSSDNWLISVFQACSFLLSTPDQVDYSQLYNACISLLLAGTGVDKVKDKLTILVNRL